MNHVFPILVLIAGLTYVAEGIPLKESTLWDEVCAADLPKWAHKCPEWAKAGLCDNRTSIIFMHHYCRKSCGLPCKPVTTKSPETKPPSPPAFCRDRASNCEELKKASGCEPHNMAVYCGVTCNTCKDPTPDTCYDIGSNCIQMKQEGSCQSTIPSIEYEVKTNCLATCEFCVPDFP